MGGNLSGAACINEKSYFGVFVSDYLASEFDKNYTHSKKHRLPQVFHYIRTYTFAINIILLKRHN